MNPIEKIIDYVVKDEIIEDAEREEMISSARLYYTNMKGKISDKNAELAALTERVGKLLWVVKRLEYIEEADELLICPICRNEKPAHYLECELAEALALQEAQ